jgi:AN1-type zinc finger and ubiquitin domain-containing protein 1
MLLLINRCGNNFCSLHRNAEAHNCTFDYKTEGRKILEHSNPLVAAPKLPKI